MTNIDQCLSLHFYHFCFFLHLEISFCFSIPTENSPVAQRESPPAVRERVAPATMAMPHLPITATTKTADTSASSIMKSPDSPSSPMRTLPPAITDLQSSTDRATMDNQPQGMMESPVHQGLSDQKALPGTKCSLVSDVKFSCYLTKILF